VRALIDELYGKGLGTETPRAAQQTSSSSSQPASAGRPTSAGLPPPSRLPPPSKLPPLSQADGIDVMRMLEAGAFGARTSASAAAGK